MLLLTAVINQFTYIMKKWSPIYSSRSDSNSWGGLTKEIYVYDSLWMALLLTLVWNQFTKAMTASDFSLKLVY